MRSFFFIHVMKTAGTTFVRALQEQFPAEAIYPSRGIDWTSPTDVEAYINIPRLVSLPDARKAQVKIYTGHFPFMVCDLIDPDLVTLSVLRDPVDRTISVLKQVKRREARFRDVPLEAIYDDRPTFRFFVENHQTKVFSLTPDDHEVAINCGLTIDAARYAQAQANLSRVDVIGFTESFDAFIADVRTRFGWWPAGVDPQTRVNVSNEDWDVDPTFRARIAADNAYDMQLYEYAKSLTVRSR